MSMRDRLMTDAEVVRHVAAHYSGTLTRARLRRYRRAGEGPPSNWRSDVDEWARAMRFPRIAAPLRPTNYDSESDE
jgi:hypothetical protein